jgi:hypothetical protein
MRDRVIGGLAAVSSLRPFVMALVATAVLLIY